jgi:hypothetical protein
VLSDFPSPLRFFDQEGMKVSEESDKKQDVPTHHQRHFQTSENLLVLANPANFQSNGFP